MATKRVIDRQLAGTTVGKWTVLDRKELRARSKSKTSLRAMHWMCRCTCGDEVWVAEQSIVRGISKGCLTCNGKPFKDLTGLKVGRWSVLYQDPERRHGWMCRCDCGTEKWVQSNGLVSGASRGCVRCKEVLDLSVPDGFRMCRSCRQVKPTTDFTSYNAGKERHTCGLCTNEWRRKDRAQNTAKRCWWLHWYAKKRAKKSGLPFDITVADLVAIYPADDCCPVFHMPFLKTGSGKMNPSVDRIRPALGYVVGNVAIISRKANTIKSDATSAELRLVAEWAADVESAQVLAFMGG